jgi:hypothetical protein
MIDMTDYEDTFSGINEMEEFPLVNVGMTRQLYEEPYPDTYTFSDYEDFEEYPENVLGKTHRDIIEDRKARIAAEEEEEE